MSNADDDSSTFPGCLICEDVFDPHRKVVYDSEHFFSYVTPIYPWGVILASRRHDCDQPWAMTDDEAVDLGRMIRRLTAAMHKSGSDRTYLLALNEEKWLPMPHFHMGVLSRYEPMAEGAHAMMYGRARDFEKIFWGRPDDEIRDPAQVATDFAAAMRAVI